MPAAGASACGWAACLFDNSSQVADAKALAAVLTAYCGCWMLLLQEKIDVNGPKTHPVYQYLKGACSNCSGDVRWNFAGKLRSW